MHRQQQHYVFGFGSLICAESRAVTASALGEESGQTAIPIRLRDWARLWNLRGSNTNTYLGVRPQPEHSCVGVLVPLPLSENKNADDEVLEALDRRERGYDRHRVDLNLIERVDDLLLTSIDDDDDDDDDDDESDNSHEETKDGYSDDTMGKQWRTRAIEEKYYKDTFLQWNCADTSPATVEYHADVCVWIYVPKECYTNLARPQNAILQSYVDICLRGCLSISDAFAREFVKGTFGWHPGHAPCELLLNSQDDSNADHEHWWINDRDQPIYVRADRQFSLDNSDILDGVFDPLLLKRRKQG